MHYQYLLDNLSEYATHYISIDRATLVIIKQYKTVNIILDISGRTISDVVSQIVIPEQFRPSIYKRGFAIGAWQNTNVRGTLVINTDGTIHYTSTTDNSVTTSISMTYVI